VYAKAVREFNAYCLLHRRSLRTQASRDKALNAYIHSLYFNGEPATAARMALYGLVHEMVLTLKDPQELLLSRAALRGFVVDAPERQRDPMPWEACMLICEWLLLQHDPLAGQAAEVVLACWDGYLRPSEALSLKSGSILVVKRRATILEYGEVSAVLAPSRDDDGDKPNDRTKAGMYDDTVFFGDSVSRSCGRGFVAALLKKKKAARRPLQKLWDINLGSLDRFFADAVRATGLRGLRLTPHCARHGAASTDFALGLRDLSAVQRKGRWLAEASVRRYEKAGRLNKQVCLMSREQLSSSKRACNIVAHFCS
jgi:integrase